MLLTRAAVVGCLLVLALVPGTLYVSVAPVAAERQQQDIPIPGANQASVVNIQGTTATISWVTSTRVAGQVLYTEGTGAPTIPAVDQRGPGYDGFTHYVTLSNLSPDTTYTFQISTAAGQQATFRTGSILTTTPEPIVTGKVLKTTGDPAEEAIVYARVIKPDGTTQSALLSSIVPVGEAGTYRIELGHARTQDHQRSFGVPTSGDQQAGWKLILLAQYSGDPLQFTTRTLNLTDVQTTSSIDLTIPSTGASPTPTPAGSATAGPTPTPTATVQSVAATATAIVAATMTAAVPSPSPTPAIEESTPTTTATVVPFTPTAIPRVITDTPTPVGVKGSLEPSDDPVPTPTQLTLQTPTVGPAALESPVPSSAPNLARTLAVAGPGVSASIEVEDRRLVIDVPENAVAQLVQFAAAAIPIDADGAVKTPDLGVGGPFPPPDGRSLAGEFVFDVLAYEVTTGKPVDRFDNLVTLRFKVDPSLAASDQQVTAAYWDGRQWTDLTSHYDPATSQLIAETEHLSVFGLLTGTSPAASPVTNGAAVTTPEPTNGIGATPQPSTGESAGWPVGIWIAIVVIAFGGGAFAGVYASRRWPRAEVKSDE